MPEGEGRAIEILKEAAPDAAGGAERGYVTVRFTARHETLGAVATVRTFRLPSGPTPSRFLEEEYDRWLDLIDRAAEF